MMTTSPRSVFDRMLTLSRAMDQAFGPDRGLGPVWESAPTAQLWLPPLDTYETERAFVVQADLPGVRLEDVEVTFEQNTLTIKGTRPPTLQAPENGELRVYTAERLTGGFARSVRLPEYVDGERIEATHENGVLTVTVPKAPSALPRKIAIGGGTEARRLNA